MRTSTFLLLLLLFCCISCEKDDFVYSYPETNKLLISVTRTQGESEFRAEFKYDSFNRIVEVKNIFENGDPAIESYKYDNDGRMVKKSSDYSSTTYNYDEGGQLIEQIVEDIYSQDGWSQKTEFKYKDGRIDKGIEYSRKGEVQNQIFYKYDSTGNTLEKFVKPANDEYDFNLIEMKFRYDTKINPLASNGVGMPLGFVFSQYPDINQINNPIYSSYSNLIMSSIPPEYEISYKYNSDDLPVQAELKNIRFTQQELVIVEYKYRNKN